jgi:HK97 gp10 family phage protein
VGYKADLHRLFPPWMERIPQLLMEEIVDYAGEVCLEAAKARAPVGDEADGDKHPGWLRDHIELRVDKAPGIVKAIVSIKDKEVPYAVAVAFGDKRHEPNSFMEEARDEAKEKVKLKIKDISRDAIRRAKAGG